MTASRKISRRQVIRRLVTGCAAARVVQDAIAQSRTGADRRTGLIVKPSHEFRDASLLAVSPNGKLLSLRFTMSPLMTFSIPGGFSKATRASGGALRIVEFDSWNTVRTYSLSKRVSRASFFADSRRFYAEEWSVSGPDGPNIVLHIENDTTDRFELVQARDEAGQGFFALDGQKLLRMVGSDTGYRFTLSSLPEYREIGSSPLLTNRRGGRPTPYFVVSADRGVVAHAMDHELSCLRTSDLGLKWTRQIDRTYLGVWTLASNADGSRVAAAVIDTAFIAQQKDFYVGIYDGNSGEPVASLPVNGFEGLALSPDGELLAVGEKIQRGRDIHATVVVYDVASGSKVASVLHDRVRPGNAQTLRADFTGLEFTSDGKYLVTSANNVVKVWQLLRT